eukprot:CAMPEP_0119343410 /NCGR_PEP_ID=MMETSP1333-20130426/106433_1 /TAXON_ID=418940 /ORGANISM="Scyphosphaera apsteinii, Strain RCC1455" /LENGTH=62 /DNA_ID=CAMNT_0007355799 /DNA_START=733 /DNA_END=921 /DNA_ORIENTATION=+
MRPMSKSSRSIVLELGQDGLLEEPAGSGESARAVDSVRKRLAVTVRGCQVGNRIKFLIYVKG